jgi:hypothetical protein
LLNALNLVVFGAPGRDRNAAAAPGIVITQGHTPHSTRLAGRRACENKDVCVTAFWPPYSRRV